jgi:hypothetical protein
MVEALLSRMFKPMFCNCLMVMLVWATLTMDCYGQTLTFPDGVYFSYESLLAGTPDRMDTLKVIRRSEGDILWSGGNDYKFESDEKEFGWRQVHKKALAYVKNDSIFLNGSKMELESAFCLALTKGMYLAFYNAENNNTGGVAAAGILGGAIGGAIAAAASQDRGNTRGALYVLSLKTGNAKRIGSAYVMARLNENLPELLEPYVQNADHDSDVVILRYLQMLNDALSKQTKH